MPLNLFNATDSNAGLAETPVKILVELYLTECQSRNLQPKTLEFYKHRLDMLVEVFGNHRVGDVSTAHLRILLNNLIDSRGWNTQNTNHCIQVWKSFFNYLDREEIIESNPARGLQKLRQEQRFPKVFTPQEIKALLGATQDNFSGNRDYAMMLVLLDTGVRIGELMSLDIDAVDLVHGQLRVFGKGRKERFVPFASTVRKVLIKYIALRNAKLQRHRMKAEALWLSVEGTRLTMDGFRSQLREYSRASGVSDVHPHRFRHTFATQFLTNGGSPQWLQRILGHTTPIMTQRYVHLTDDGAKLDHNVASPVQAWALDTKKK